MGAQGTPTSGQHLVPVRNDFCLTPPGHDRGFLAVRNAIRIGPEFRIIDDRVHP